MRALPAGFIAPCLPTKALQPPSGEEWLHEIKHDGLRVIARKCSSMRAGMGLEGIVSKRKGSAYRSGRTADWLKAKNPDAPAVTRLADEDWSWSRR